MLPALPYFAQSDQCILCDVEHEAEAVEIIDRSSFMSQPHNLQLNWSFWEREQALVCNSQLGKEKNFMWIFHGNVHDTIFENVYDNMNI
jgi:hypothetical protein